MKILKKIMIVFLIIIVLAVVLILLAIFYFSPSEDKIFNYIKEHPNQSAIKIIRNREVIADFNSNKMMILGSTFKIIVAVEYAMQSAEGIIDPNEMVSLSELEKYKAGNTNGGGHELWMESIKNHSKNNKISIREIAKGMIAYSSNANTEWLIEKLGQDNINNCLDELGIKNHSNIYYIVSSIFVAKENSPDLKGKKLANQIKTLSDKEYVEIINRIHNKLKTKEIDKDNIGDEITKNIDLQKVWSDRLPASTVDEYTELMRKINSREYFDSKAQEYLEEVMAWEVDSIFGAPPKYMKYSGMKSGMTAFVLTRAVYTTDDDGNQTEIAYFFNELGSELFKINMASTKLSLKLLQLQASQGKFDEKIMTDDKFREKVKKYFLNEKL
jgi:D-alanyl-D-alanine carboxypeptidase